MRGAIVITVIVVGGLLVAAPLVAEYFLTASHEANLVRLLEKPGTNSVNLHLTPIPTGTEVACGIVGSVVLATGLFLAIRELRTPPARPRASSPPPIRDDSL